MLKLIHALPSLTYTDGQTRVIHVVALHLKGVCSFVQLHEDMGMNELWHEMSRASINRKKKSGAKLGICKSRAFMHLIPKKKKIKYKLLVIANLSHFHTMDNSL